MNYVEKAAIVRKVYPSAETLTIFVVARTKANADRLLDTLDTKALKDANIVVERPIIVTRYIDKRDYYLSTVRGRTAIGVISEEFSVLPYALQDQIDRSLLSASYALKIPTLEMFEIVKI